MYKSLNEGRFTGRLQIKPSGSGDENGLPPERFYG